MMPEIFRIAPATAVVMVLTLWVISKVAEIGETAFLPKASRSIEFGDTLINKRSIGGSSSRKRLRTKSLCGLACARLPACRSYNFCTAFCELNSEDLFSGTSNDFYLIDDFTSAR